MDPITVAIFLSVKGSKQGVFYRTPRIKIHKNQMPVLAFSHQILMHDPITGPTGKLTNEPLVITKEIDKASPQFFTALVTSENLIEVKLEYYRISSTAASVTEELWYTIKLTNATVSDIQMSYDPLKDGKPVEKISFTHQKMEVEYVKDHITAADN